MSDRDTLAALIHDRRTCDDCGKRLSDDPTARPRRINPTFIT